MTHENDEHDEGPDETADDQLAGVLRELLGPQGDLRSTVTHKVDRSLQGRSMVGALTDLAGTGWNTIRLLLTNPADAADGEAGPSTHRQSGEGTTGIEP